MLNAGITISRKKIVNNTHFFLIGGSNHLYSPGTIHMDDGPVFTAGQTKNVRRNCGRAWLLPGPDLRRTFLSGPVPAQ
jgi:hypothetical protein